QLSDPSIALPPFLFLFSTVPQLLLPLYFAFRYRRDVALSLVLSTIVFVAVNRVITAQYFIWYGSLLPLLLPYLQMAISRVVIVIALWFATELHWLFWGFQLEFNSFAAFYPMWLASLAFFGAHVYIVLSLISAYPKRPPEQLTSEKSTQ